MCKWYCLSEGPNTNLSCLHCGTHYCQACLFGEAGKMTSIIKCASCGKKPRTKPISNLKADPSQGEYNKAQIAKALANLRENDAGSKPNSRPSTALGHSRSSSMGSNKGKNTVFDRLTDTARYTSTHKHRFDDQGRGKGLFGRDSIPKGRDYTSPNALEIYRRAEYQTF